MKIILHLGAHKTGTTLIQGYMRDNKLLMRLNLIGSARRADAVKSIGWGRPDHMTANFAPLLASIERHEKRKKKSFVISFENALGRPIEPGKSALYPSGKESAATLAALMSNHDIKVIYYIRSQWDFLESYYLQTINEGSHQSFDVWLSEIRMKSISWTPIIATLRDTFGADRVFVRDFYADMAGGQAAFLQRFFAHVRPELGPARFRNFQYAKVKNPSIGDKGLAIALAANHLLVNNQERGAMRVFLQSHFSNEHYPRPELLSADQKEALKKRFGGENASLLTELPTTAAAGRGIVDKLLSVIPAPGRPKS